jgi:hypothetical protein
MMARPKIKVAPGRLKDSVNEIPHIVNDVLTKCYKICYFLKYIFWLKKYEILLVGDLQQIHKFIQSAAASQEAASICA